MDRSNTEVEIKLRFAQASSAHDAAAQLGATCVQQRHFEDNVLYDREFDPLKDADKLLRLRRVGERTVLTYKAPVAGSHRHKVRIEHETAIGDFDAMARVLDGLGFTPAYRYQKYRTLYELEGLHVCVDETPIGCFVELEGRPETIDRVAEQLGFGTAQFIRSTYRELHEAAAGKRGGDLGDLVFDQAPGTPQAD
jgi:adenylate cyclase class 2